MKIIFLIVIFSLCLLGLFSSESFAQQYIGILTLDSIPSQIKSGDTIVFSGSFTTNEGRVIQDALIYIKDDIRFGSDDILGTVTTDKNGKFKASWTAIPRSSGSYDFYAIYEGSNNIAKSRSLTYSVNVITSNSVQNDYQKPNNVKNYFSTLISLDKIPPSIYSGQIMTFTGTLTSNGQPVKSALINIKEDDPLIPDQLLGSGMTDSNGKFKIPWQISRGYFEKDFDIYAVFEGNSNYLYSRSPNQIMSVISHSGSIRLNQLPSSANIGESITFSGTLQLDHGSSKGAIVYIKDEDPLSRDDLLATAYVDEYGKFSTNWIVTDVDVDGVADIYAEFKGNEEYYRLTTCDNGPTMNYGGTCLDTIKLPIYYSNTPPIPPPSGNQSDEYMGLFYSLDFTRIPHIAIVPNPDVYNEIRPYIIPAEEGILMWNSHLTGKYGGNWNVDFEVVTPDKLFFESKPDVVINLVTPEQDSHCSADYYGVTYIKSIPSKPVQASVCVSNNQQKLSQSQVSATSAHEFIHAVGLGHAWNKQGDLMCSVESGQETCPGSYSKLKTPSELNLAGVVRLYGTDGFLNPNYHASYNSKFYPDSTVPEIVNSNTSNQNQLPSDIDKDGINDNVDKCPTVKETINGYLDDDGCPDNLQKIDTKPMTKQNSDTMWDNSKTIEIQHQANTDIENLKKFIILTQKEIDSIKLESQDAKKELDYARNSLSESKKSLVNAELTQKEGDEFIKKSKYSDAYYKYDYSLKMTKNGWSLLDKVDSHVSNANLLEENYQMNKIKQITQKSTQSEPEKEKTCFLFWCW